MKPPLYYYRDADKNEIDLLIENGDSLHPIEIKTTSDPAKSMVKAYRCLTKNSDSVGVFSFFMHCLAGKKNGANLLARILHKDNLNAAFKRVRQNGGAAGVHGI